MKKDYMIACCGSYWSQLSMVESKIPCIHVYVRGKCICCGDSKKKQTTVEEQLNNLKDFLDKFY